MTEIKKVIKEVTHRILDENKMPDSMELGNTKDGKVKVYMNFDDKDKCKEKIDNALEMRKYANMKIEL